MLSGVGDRQGSFSSINELTQAIASHLAERNLNLVRYMWRTSGFLNVLSGIKSGASEVCQLPGRA